LAYATLIGAEVRRKEDPRLIRGHGTYVADLKLPGMLHVTLVRSPHAHARINAIDTSAAQAVPGVRMIVTGADMRDRMEPLPLAGAGEGSTGAGPYSGRERRALAVEQVRYVGEPVVAIIAESPASASDAADLIQIDWEPLAATTDPARALDPAAPLVFASMSDNLDHRRRRRRGDPDTAFATAAHILRERMVSQRLMGMPLEGRAVVAAPDPLTEGLTLWTSTQTPHQIRSELAAIVNLPQSRIRVVAPDVGGGFGVKIGIYPEDALLAALALHLQTPLRWVEQRLEHTVATTHGRAQIADLEIAVTTEGVITALRGQIRADLGAYPLAPGLPDLTTAMGIGVYRIEHVDLESVCVYTHTTPVAAYRGAGRPEAAYYIERLVDMVAFELDLDPAEVRRRNFIPPEAFPYKTATGLTYDSGEYEQALAKALERADYPRLRAEQAERLHNDGPLLGIGMACYVEMCGFGPYESAQVKVEPGGSVTIATGISPHGQGSVTTFAQIVADQLGADFDQIVVRHSDTAVTPMGVGTMGSRSLAVGGAALVRATAKVREQARRIAAAMLEARVEDIELTNGSYHVRGMPSGGLTLTQIAKKAYSSRLPGDIENGLEAIDYFRPDGLIYPFGAHIAVVEIDRDTGEVRLHTYVSVDDCGPRISPQIVIGQIHGGLAQGIAQALLEEVVYDAYGQLISGSLMDYALPRADMFPDFTIDQTETPTPLNPLGVKGIGEAATIGSTPAVANAVLDALKHLGLRHLDLPLRPERIWRALHQK
jgi:carbon-monoxide dehydrogenase large subunit